MLKFKQKLNSLKRVSFDIATLVIIFISILFLPDIIFPASAKIGLSSIFVSKFIFISAGIVHAHISRKLIFPYIDFQKEPDIYKKIMVIIWYFIVVTSWARGG